MLAYLPCAEKVHHRRFAHARRHRQEDLVQLTVFQFLHCLHDRTQCLHSWLIEPLLWRTVDLTVEHVLFKIPRSLQEQRCLVHLKQITNIPTGAHVFTDLRLHLTVHSVQSPHLLRPVTLPRLSRIVGFKPTDPLIVLEVFHRTQEVVIPLCVLHLTKNLLSQQIRSGHFLFRPFTPVRFRPLSPHTHSISITV